MSNQIQYLIDRKGRKTSVVVPYSEWEELNKNYIKLVNKVRVLTGIREGITEVKKAKKSGEQLQTLTDFLNESNHS